MSIYLEIRLGSAADRGRAYLWAIAVQMGKSKTNSFRPVSAAMGRLNAGDSAARMDRLWPESAVARIDCGPNRLWPDSLDGWAGQRPPG